MELVVVDADVLRDELDSLDVLLVALCMRSAFSLCSPSVFSLLDFSWLRLRRFTRLSAIGDSSDINAPGFADRAKKPLDNHSYRISRISLALHLNLKLYYSSIILHY